jgi:dolichol-phosphate mannosyltransferase
MKALVIIPTYNEIENIGSIVPAVLDRGDAFHVLVVDDNSPDGTGREADRLSEAHPGRVFVLHRERKEGLGRAYVAGFQWALERDAEYIFEMDADFSHDPKRLPALLEGAGTCDLVLGSRYVEGGGVRNWGLVRKCISRGGSLYARWILGLPLRDLTGGFKCFSRKVLEALPLESIRSSGYAFQVEMTYRAFLKGFRIREIPIIFEDRRVGCSKMSRKIFMEALWLVPRLRLQKGRLQS